MRSTFSRFVGLLSLLVLLTSSVWAQKNWTVDSEKLSFRLNGDFEKSGQPSQDSFLILFSSSKNVQILLSRAKASKKNDPKAKPVTTEEFQKAFPVLIADARLDLVGEPTTMDVSGSSAVIYSVRDSTNPEYETVYAFVGRGKTPYTVILNYPSPFNLGMTELMKKMLSTVKHS